MPALSEISPPVQGLESVLNSNAFTGAERGAAGALGATFAENELQAW